MNMVVFGYWAFSVFIIIGGVLLAARAADWKKRINIGAVTAIILFAAYVNAIWSGPIPGPFNNPAFISIGYLAFSALALSFGILKAVIAKSWGYRFGIVIVTVIILFALYLFTLLSTFTAHHY